jgi:hypothetical protein
MSAQKGEDQAVFPIHDGLPKQQGLPAEMRRSAVLIPE